jgi:hypothetical protein
MPNVNDRLIDSTGTLETDDPVLEDRSRHPPGIDFTKLHSGRKLFWINFHPQIFNKFPPE